MGGADLQKRLVKRIREVSPRQRKQQYTQCSDMMNVPTTAGISTDCTPQRIRSCHHRHHHHHYRREHFCRCIDSLNSSLQQPLVAGA
ncbi:hypothetical protein ACH3XW_12800 [Acanthocheilonema viteae]